MNFCDKCKKLVPDNEIRHYSELEFRGELIPERNVHEYQRIINANGPSSGMNFRLGTETVYCGDVREPEDWEYFLYITWGMEGEFGEDDDLS